MKINNQPVLKPLTPPQTKPVKRQSQTPLPQGDKTAPVVAPVVAPPMRPVSPDTANAHGDTPKRPESPKMNEADARNAHGDTPQPREKAGNEADARNAHGDTGHLVDYYLRSQVFRSKL